MVVETSLERLGAALNFFQTCGYVYVDCPWTVDIEYLMATCPHERYVVDSTVGPLVGSAEQSFVMLDATGQLPKGKYVGYTPCFRNEATGDFHRPYFNKVELYRTDDVSNDALNQMIFDAQCSFRGDIHRFAMVNNLPRDLPETAVRVEKTDEGFDITVAGIEVGSYGIRSWRDLKWVYGTGMAEPRLSMAIDRLR